MRPTSPLPPVLICSALLSGCLPGAPSLPAPPASPAVESAASFADTALSGVAIHDDCFQRHLREAIVLNERRLPVYSEWSGGESEEISRSLMRLERLALTAAWQVDRRARSYHEAGIPIVCAEFESMALAPPLPDRPGAPPAGSYTAAPPPDTLRHEILTAYGSGGFPAVEAAADRRLRALGSHSYNCMTRHLLESIRRVAWTAPIHMSLSRRQELPEPRELLELLLRLNLSVLDDAAELDRRAGPLQARGIPILCADVPPIPAALPRRRRLRGRGSAAEAALRADTAAPPPTLTARRATERSELERDRTTNIRAQRGLRGAAAASAASAAASMASAIACRPLRWCRTCRDVVQALKSMNENGGWDGAGRPDR